VSRFNGSIINGLQEIYPDHSWTAKRRPNGYWDSMEHVKLFVKDFERKMGIVQLSDWHKVSLTDILKQGGAGWLHRYVYIQI
jgi:hypothetical protein